MFVVPRDKLNKLPMQGGRVIPIDSSLLSRVRSLFRDEDRADAWKDSGLLLQIVYSTMDDPNSL
jgi:hypothetical protein